MTILSEKEAIVKSIDIWTWLVDNFPAKKQDYPGFFSEGFNDMSCYCPCCEYYNRANQFLAQKEGCYKCPLSVNGEDCMLWDIWDDYINNHESKFKTEEEAKEAALISAKTIVMLLKVRNNAI